MISNGQVKTTAEILSRIRQQYGDEAITNSTRCKGYFADIAPNYIGQQQLLTAFLDCGGSMLGTAADNQEAHVLSCCIVNQMVSQYHTTPEDARSICAEYASVFGLNVFRSAPGSGSAKTIPPKPVLSDDCPPKPGLLKFSDLRPKVKLVFLFGILLILYILWIANHFVYLKLGYMFFAALIVVGLGEWYILKSGLPLAKKDQSGKYQEGKAVDGLLMLAFIYFLAILFLLHDPVESSHFRVVGAAFLVNGYGYSLLFASTPKEKQSH